MPEIYIQSFENIYQVRFEYPDFDTKIFGFATMEAAQQAIDLARYVQDNEISLAHVWTK